MDYVIKFYKRYKSDWVVVGGCNYNADNVDELTSLVEKMGYCIPSDKRTSSNNIEYYYSNDCTEFRNIVVADIPKTYTNKNNKIVSVGDLKEYLTHTFYNIKECEECGDLIDIDISEYYEEFEGNYYCGSDCFYEHHFCCDDCGAIYCDDDLNHAPNGHWYCNDCYDEHYVQCECCGSTIERDYAYWSEYDNSWYCEDCYHNDSIDDWYDSDGWEVQRTSYENSQLKRYEKLIERLRAKMYSIESTFKIGFELEVEVPTNVDRYNVCDTTNALMNNVNRLVHFDEDGSLDHGIEFDTNPLTWDCLQDKKALLKTWLEKLSSIGCKSHDTSTCGLHIHFNRSAIDNDSTKIDRCIYLFEKYKYELGKLSRRNGDYHWCHFYQDKTSDKVDFKYIKEKATKGYHADKYMAVNTQHNETIEIRLFKGTLKFETLMASIELVRNIVAYINEKTDEDLENSKFEDIIYFRPTEYLKQYAIEKEVI